jgi:hypothetical protein
MNEVLSGKVDFTMLRNNLETKVNINELDAFRKVLDSVSKQVEMKCSYKDLDMQII